MVPIFELSLRQLAGRWRLLIIIFLTSLPVGITMIIRAVDGDTAIAGALNDDNENGADAGSAYIHYVSAIPAVSSWGVAIMALLIVGAGCVAFRRRVA